MIPVMLDPRHAHLGLVGGGELCVRRLGWLRAGGAEPQVFAPDPSPEMIEAAGIALVRRWPTLEDIQALHAIWVADIAPGEAECIAELARGAGVLVNVEDVLPLCDFHTPAVLRRGRLVIAAGTGGASPAIAQAVRRKLEDTFPDVWAEALDDIAAAREALRAQGATIPELAADARRRMGGWGL